jgi:hypothetical protein
MILLVCPKRKSLILTLIILFAMHSHPEAPVESPSLQKTVATKRTRNLTITITNAKGVFNGGENRFCIQFQERPRREPILISNVSVAFRELVGRIEEQPIGAVLGETHNGEYCGHVDLGRQYYDPSSYYLFVRYSHNGNKISQLLFVTAIGGSRK